MNFKCAKVGCLEGERLLQEEVLNQFKNTLQKQKLENKDLTDKLAGLDDINASSQQLVVQL